MTEPPSNAALEQIARYIQQAHRVAIVTHERPDADALGSSLGLAHALRRLGKEATVFLFDPVPFGLDFLPGLDQIVADLPGPETDLVVAVDAGEPAQIGSRLYDAILRLGVPLIVVDHHESNTGYGMLSAVFPQKASTAEVVLMLVQMLGVPMDQAVATCLLAGVVFDTRAFATPDTGPETLQAAALLMESGGSLYEVMTAYRGQHPLKALRLWGEALNRMEARDGVAWTFVSREMYRATGTTMEDTEGLANFILDAADVRISMVFRERPEGGMIRVSARAKPGINLVPLARSFPTGGGHKMAVGFEADPPQNPSFRCGFFMDGILNLNKPRGMTSHDVVARVRAVARQREVGHAGTLDPMATGVLLLCLGRATRLTEYLMDSPKLYRARVRLGITTDTDDAEGSVIAERPVEADRAAVEAVLERFRGPILQVPPMYSALKRDGQPLYRLARRGQTVEREPRRVEIYRLDLTAWEPPELTLEVLCSPGTYIRALARDLGEALGCGAHLTGLVRLASGDFRLEDAAELDAVTPERLPDLLLPPDAALRRYPALYLTDAEANAVRHGRDIRVAQDLSCMTLARAYGPDGRLLAVLEYRPDRGLWHPRKVLV